jgi:hypothetical protein
MFNMTTGDSLRVELRVGGTLVDSVVKTSPIRQPGVREKRSQSGMLDVDKES